MSGEEEQRVTIETLPSDELAKIMTFLRVQDVFNLQACSKSLNESCRDEKVWYEMCDNAWNVTDIRKWVKKSEKPPRRSPPPPSSRLLQGRPPASYQQLFYLLKHVESIIGLWRVIGEGPQGQLISFSWSEDGIVGETISYSSLKRKPEYSPYLSIRPCHGQPIEVEWGENEATATLKVLPLLSDQQFLHRSPSAEAAAAVSYGCSPTASSTLGTSPEGSFEYAWLEFMSSSVAKSAKKSRRRFSRGAGSTIQGAPAPILHHLRRVDLPTPNPRHPHAGLFVGNYLNAGFQVVRISYDFTGRAARIIADKVTGDEGVAAGQRTWWAVASAISQPWSREELEVMEELQRLELELAEEGALDGLESLFLEDNSDGENGAESRNNRNEKKVVAIHFGAGQVGVGTQNSREWVEGRLWVYEDGCLKFWWLEDIMQGVEMRRIDAAELLLV